MFSPPAMRCQAAGTPGREAAGLSRWPQTTSPPTPSRCVIFTTLILVNSPWRTLDRRWAGSLLLPGDSTGGLGQAGRPVPILLPLSPPTPLGTLLLLQLSVGGRVMRSRRAPSGGQLAVGSGVPRPWWPYWPFSSPTPLATGESLGELSAEGEQRREGREKHRCADMSSAPHVALPSFSHLCSTPK